MELKKCPNCNFPITSGSAFCDNCGLKLSGAQAAPAQPARYSGSFSSQQPTSQDPGAALQCSNCGAVNVSGSAFCENCGIQLSAAVPAVPPPIPLNEETCPQCGFANVPGASYCEECGTHLGEAAAPVHVPQPNSAPVSLSEPPPIEQISPSIGFIVGRLVIQSSNVSLPLPQGQDEITIGRDDPVSNVFPDINLDSHGGHEAGVGRLHARLVLSNGQLCLVDLNSLNGSFVNRQKIVPGQPQPVNHGDEIRLGRMVLTYYTN